MRQAAEGINEALSKGRSSFFLVPFLEASEARVNPVLLSFLEVFIFEDFSHFFIYYFKRPLLELYAFSEGTSSQQSIKLSLPYNI